MESAKQMQTFCGWGSATGTFTLNINIKSFAFNNDKEMNKVKEGWSYASEGFYKIPIDECNR